VNDIIILRNIVDKLTKKLSESTVETYGFKIISKNSKSINDEQSTIYILECGSCGRQLSFFANVSSKTFPDGSGVYRRVCNHCPAEFYIHAFPHGEILGCVQYEQHEGN